MAQVNTPLKMAPRVGDISHSKNSLSHTGPDYSSRSDATHPYVKTPGKNSIDGQSIVDSATIDPVQSETVQPSYQQARTHQLPTTYGTNTYTQDGSRVNYPPVGTIASGAYISGYGGQVPHYLPPQNPAFDPLSYQSQHPQQEYGFSSPALKSKSDSGSHQQLQQQPIAAMDTMHYPSQPQDYQYMVPPAPPHHHQIQTMPPQSHIQGYALPPPMAASATPPVMPYYVSPQMQQQQRSSFMAGAAPNNVVGSAAEHRSYNFTENNLKIIKHLLPIAEQHKWKYLAARVSKARSKKFTADFVKSKSCEIFHLPYSEEEQPKNEEGEEEGEEEKDDGSQERKTNEEHEKGKEHQEKCDGILGTSVPYLVQRESALLIGEQAPAPVQMPMTGNVVNDYATYRYGANFGAPIMKKDY